MAPSDSTEPSGTVKLQLPSISRRRPEGGAVRKELNGGASYCRACEGGVGSLVTELDPELMTGAANAMRSGSDGPTCFYILSREVSTHHELTVKPTVAFTGGIRQIIHLK